MTKYCQFDEEKHLWAILELIGDGSKVCTDIGARLEGSNVARLIEDRGYRGHLYDMSEKNCEELKAKFPKSDVSCIRVTIENVNLLVPSSTHVLSIDVDSYDWWLWANLKWRPAVVIIETTPCEGMQVAEYGAAKKDSKGYGTSLSAAKALGMMKRYDYITRTEANAIFVRGDLECTYRAPDAATHQGRRAAKDNSVFP